MSASPYLSQELKDYMNQHKIEQILGEKVNQLLRGKYEDPYGFLMNQFGKMASSSIAFKGVQGYQQLTSEGLPTIKIIVTVQYQLKDYSFALENLFTQGSEISIPLMDESDEKFGNKGMQKACSIINNTVNKLIQNKTTLDQKSIDEALCALIQENGKKGFNISLPISYALPIVNTKIHGTQLYSEFRKMFGYIPKREDLTRSMFIPNGQQANQVPISSFTGQEKSSEKPKIMVNIFQGSKLVGLKCQVFQFYMILQNYLNGFEAFDIINNISQAVQKTICSGKQGEAALKYFGDGTFLCPADTIMDNLKILEEAIVKSPFKDRVTIGIAWQADNFYNPDKQNYELENPKQLFDATQLSDYYLKLCTDQPIITYMEDPIMSDDFAGWQIFMKKLAGKVKIGSRKLYSSLEKAKRHVELATKESNSDLGTQEAIQNYNSLAVLLDYFIIRPTDFPTLTKFLEYTKYISTKTAVVLSDNFTEMPVDPILVDLAFSINNCYLNMATPVKIEKMMKFNRIIQICQLESI